MAKRKDWNAEEKYSFLRTNKISLNYVKFVEFWVETQRSPGPFLCELIRYIAKVEQGSRNPSTSVELSLSTLALLMFNIDYDTTDELYQTCLRIARSKWDKLRRTHASVNPVTEDFINCALRLGGDREELMNILLTHATTLPIPIQSFDDLSHISYSGQQVTVVYPTDLSHSYGLGSFYFSTNPKFSTIECGEFSLTYSYIKRQIAEAGEVSPQIIEILCMKFQEIKNRVSSGNYKTAEASLLALIRIVENLIVQFPITDFEHLEQLLVEIDIFRRWPLPFGSAASYLVELICKEMKVPGTAMLQKLSEEWPLLDIHIPYYERTDRSDKEELNCWSAFIIVDSSDSPEFIFINEIAKYKAPSKQDKLKQDLLSVELKLARPLNHSLFEVHVYRIWIIFFKLSLFNQINVEDLTAVTKLEGGDIFKTYSKVLEIAERSQFFDNKRARNLQEELHTDLVNEILRKDAGDISSLTRTLFSHFSSLKSYRLQLPKYHLKLIDIGNDHMTELEETGMSKLSEIDDSGMLTKEEAFSFGTLYGAFSAILARSMDSKSLQNKSPVRVILTGSDELFHKFLLAFVSSISNDSEILGGVDLRVYVLPTYGCNSTLAQYLSSVDLWYQRHIYIPFAMRPWAPKLDFGLTDHKATSSTTSEPTTQRHRSLLEQSDLPYFDQLLPISVSADLLQDYLLEANRMLSLNIYEVHCWSTSEDADHTPEDLIIPFGLYVDIGVQAAAKRLQQKNPTMKEKSLNDIIAMKNFVYEPLQITIIATQMDLFGVEYPAPDEATRFIHSLSVSNVPRESDATTPAIPNAEWLELSYLEPESAIQLAAYLKKKKGRKNRDSQADINVAASTLYSNLHIIKADLISRSTPMDLLVDGRLYGPFRMIRIKPFTLEDRLWPTVPLMTFCDPDT